MEDFDTNIDYDGNIPESFRAVQEILDQFVAVNYDTLETMVIGMKADSLNIKHYKAKILDIIRNNPPLMSVPRYYQDGRADYLWYSNFYDDITKEAYLQYRTFIPLASKITPTNYTEELAKIDLPYFGALVDLISLEQFCLNFREEEQPIQVEEDSKELPQQEEPIMGKSQTKVVKRSYEPKFGKEQYRLLAECIEEIKVFRNRVKAVDLRKLFSGKLTEPLQVANQKSLVYLFDQLMEADYIKGTWIAVADSNRDFISFRTEGNKERYGNHTHYITMQQLMNCRNRNKREAVVGLDSIDELIEQMKANQDK